MRLSKLRILTHYQPLISCFQVFHLDLRQHVTNVSVGDRSSIEQEHLVGNGLAKPRLCVLTTTAPCSRALRMTCLARMTTLGSRPLVGSSMIVKGASIMS